MSTTGHASAGGSSGTTLIRVGLILLILIVVVVRNRYFTPEEEEKVSSSKKTTTYTPAAATATVEALVLEHECYTPCNANIAWRFKIRTEGNPIRIKFTGVRDWVEYPGEGDFKAPASMDSGDTRFESSNPKRPNVRVWVYRKRMVQK